MSPNNQADGIVDCPDTRNVNFMQAMEAVNDNYNISLSNLAKGWHVFNNRYKTRVELDTIHSYSRDIEQKRLRLYFRDNSWTDINYDDSNQMLEDIEHLDAIMFECPGVGIEDETSICPDEEPQSVKDVPTDNDLVDEIEREQDVDNALLEQFVDKSTLTQTLYKRIKDLKIDFHRQKELATETMEDLLATQKELREMTRSRDLVESHKMDGVKRIKELQDEVFRANEEYRQVADIANSMAEESKKQQKLLDDAVRKLEDRECDLAALKDKHEELKETYLGCLQTISNFRKENEELKEEETKSRQVVANLSQDLKNRDIQIENLIDQRDCAYRKIERLEEMLRNYNICPITGISRG